MVFGTVGIIVSTIIIISAWQEDTRWGVTAIGVLVWFAVGLYLMEQE